MIPNEPIQFSPIMPQHVAAPLFLEHLLDERSSSISVNISHPVSLCALLIVESFFMQAQKSLHFHFIFHVAEHFLNTNKHIF